jgi:uncharacterized repeat protein (TIGR03803 family)
MTKNRFCEFLAGGIHCCCGPHVLGKPQPKPARQPGDIMGKPNLERKAYGILLLCLTMAIASRAQTITTLHSFHRTDGAHPYAGLGQATNGKLYGTTSEGGKYGSGTVFRFTPSGKLTTLYSFAYTDGSFPVAVPIQATDGNLYGTTCDGGANGDYGRIFKITPSGKLTKLYDFAGTNGACPTADLMQAADGKLYGITYHGGAHGFGTVFKITLSGKLTTLYNFCSQENCRDGAQPAESLAQTSKGNFYGTTSVGGAHAFGTVFKITPSGKLTTLHNFAGTGDGTNPYAGLVQANGNFYGTTYGTTRLGGSSTAGTVFKITPSGKLTTLHSFAGTDGAQPYANLIQATDRNLYGTTLAGGANNCGTIFKITLGGKLTTLHSFDGADGCQSFGLIQATDGSLYGTTYLGGANGLGTVFRLSF